MQNTTLCYIEKNGTYLMLHRTKKERDTNHDKWIGLGGHCKEDESPEECIEREVKEETGLEIKNYRYAGIITFVSLSSEGEYMHLFHATDFSGQITDCTEGELEWIPIEQLESLPHWRGDEIFLRLLKDNVPFFSLKLVYNGNTLEKAILNKKELKLPT